MNYSQNKEKEHIKNTDNFVAVFSKDPYEVLKAIVAALQDDSIVIPLDPMLTAKKISQYLFAINCKKLMTNSDLPSNFNFDCQILDIKNTGKDGKLDFLALGLKKIFSNFRNELNRKTNILFTSGSVAKPKPVLHTLGNHYYSALGLSYNIKFTKEDKWLIALPFHHSSGFSIIFRAALAGATIAVKRKDEDIYEALKREKPSHISLVPHQLACLLGNIKNIDILKKLKAILLGGARVPASLIESAWEYGLNIYISYGSTEMCSTVTCTKVKDSLRHLKTVGSLLDFREIKITENKNILMRGKTLFSGYLAKTNDSEIYIKNILDRQGFYDTGDLGYIDDEGYMHIIGRKDNIFKYKAEKIHPEEIEKKFLDIKGIEDAIVVPFEKNEYEILPVIFLKSKRTFNKSLDSIKEAVKNELSYFKIPRFFLKWPDNDDRLKLSRAELKKMAQEIISLEKKDKYF